MIIKAFLRFLPGSPWTPGTMISSYFLEAVQGSSSEAAKMLERAKASGLSFPN